MALLHLVAGAVPAERLACVTVDHGLREAGHEIALVARACARLGVAHRVEGWRWSGRGNLQEAAREGRRAALQAAAGGGPVLLGHTRDDQAETVLLRLMRGSGVDGLAAMAPWAPPVLRPLLGLGRATLRDWLRARGLAWAEDPSNEDDRFDRVRVRRAMAALDLDPARLARTAAHAARAAQVLEDAARAFEAAHLRQEGGDLLIDRAALAAARDDTRARVLARALIWIGGGRRPRWEALMRAAGAQAPVTLHGTILHPEGATLRLAREPAACPEAPATARLTWDGRWRLAHPAPPPGLTVRALGRGRHAGTPALWEGARLVAAPAAGHPRGWRAECAAYAPCPLPR
jgi:tRNA(Ile)-lysidine synthase